jgi:hypothetical protein
MQHPAIRPVVLCTSRSVIMSRSYRYCVGLMDSTVLYLDASSDRSPVHCKSWYFSLIRACPFGFFYIRVSKFPRADNPLIRESTWIFGLVGLVFRYLGHPS